MSPFLCSTHVEFSDKRDFQAIKKPGIAGFMKTPIIYGIFHDRQTA